MPKRKMARRQQEGPVGIDFPDFMGPSDDDAMLSVMTGMVGASRDQMQISVELTKLVVEKNNSDSMSEEDIFSTFKRAIQVVSDSSPLKEILEKVN